MRRLILRRVPRRPLVPHELTRGPFTVADARRAGLARWHLEGASWRRVGPGIYAWAGLAETDALKLDAATLNMPASAAFAGKTAAWLHGLDINPCEPIEVILPGNGEGWERGGVRVRRAELDRREVVTRRGFRTTSMMRTLSDLWRSLSLTEAVVVTDMALHGRLSNCALLDKWGPIPNSTVRCGYQAEFKPASDCPMRVSEQARRESRDNELR